MVDSQAKIGLYPCKLDDIHVEYIIKWISEFSNI